MDYACSRLHKISVSKTLNELIIICTLYKIKQRYSFSHDDMPSIIALLYFAII